MRVRFLLDNFSLTLNLIGAVRRRPKNETAEHFNSFTQIAAGCSAVETDEFLPRLCTENCAGLFDLKGKFGTVHF